MPCFFPNPAVRQAGGRMKLLPKANQASDSTASHWLPCGVCLGCRDAQTATWALRLKHESRLHSHSIFLTPTYEEDHCPTGLQKRDMQLFWKRLRKRLHKPIKHFYCGEYGDKRKRPHYHAAVFGLDDNPFNDSKQWDTENKRSPTLDAIWGLGMVTISELTTYRMAYVAGYVLKKAGYRRQLYCDEDGVELEPPFRKMSQGLGKRWLEKYQDDLRLGYAQTENRILAIPRYYTDNLKKNLGIIGPLTVQEIKNHKLWEKIERARDEERRTREAPNPQRNKAALAIREQQVARARSRKQL